MATISSAARLPWPPTATPCPFGSAGAQSRHRRVKHRERGRARSSRATTPDAEPGAGQCPGVEEAVVPGRQARRPAGRIIGGIGPISAPSSAAASATERVTGPAVSWAGGVLGRRDRHDAGPADEPEDRLHADDPACARPG